MVWETDNEVGDGVKPAAVINDWRESESVRSLSKFPHELVLITVSSGPSANLLSYKDK